MALKSSDESGIPLCATCHRTGAMAYHNIGSEERWATLWGLDLERERERLRLAFENEIR